MQIWAAVLQAVPGSRLILKSHTFADAGVTQRYLAVFAAAGIAAERLELLPRITATEGHLAAYHRIDVALDPFPYNGTTTSCEALWMGVPVVTLRGDRFIARVGESILSTVGLKEWIAADEDDYVAKAAAMAADLPRLQRQGRPPPADGGLAALRRPPLCPEF